MFSFIPKILYKIKTAILIQYYNPNTDKRIEIPFYEKPKEGFQPQAYVVNGWIPIGLLTLGLLLLFDLTLT